MIYNILSIREYVRSLDSRLLDLTTYPDTWIDKRIEEGFAVAQDTKPVFITKEIYDVSKNFAKIVDGGDELQEIEIILQEEPHSIQTVDLDTDYFEYNITFNNHIVVRRRQYSNVLYTPTVTIVYFFHPLLPIDNMEMSVDMFRFVKEGIAANAFSWLSDEQNEQYHIKKLQALSVSSTLDINQEALSIDDTRLWRGSWS